MIRFILADLRRLWPGALAVVLLVALATALGVAVTLQERAMRLGSARAADRFDLVIGAAGSEAQLVLSSVFLQPSPLPLMPGSVLERLAADPRVQWAAPIGFGDSYNGQPVVGTTTALIANLADGFGEGRMFATEGEAVVGAAVRSSLGDRLKPMHGNAGEGGHTHTEITYEVVGRLKPTGTAWDRAILVPIQAVWHLHGLGMSALLRHDEVRNGMKVAHADIDSEPATESEPHEEDSAGEGHPDPGAPLLEKFEAGIPGLPAVLVKPKTIADAYKLRQDYRRGLTLAVFPAEVLTNLYATLGDARKVLLLVAAGAQALIAAALVFVAVLHTSQRRRQIGALRALGAPRLSVLGIAWLEMFALLATGIACGFMVGYAVARAISDAVSQRSGITMPVGFQYEDMGLALVLIAFAGLLGLIPALVAYRQSPAAALRI
jgi:putative ABC transport system permease protein